MVARKFSSKSKSVSSSSRPKLTRVLSAEDLLSKIPPEPVEIPALGGIVYVQRPTSGQLLDYAGVKNDPGNQALLELIAACIVNEDGTSLFTDDQLLRLRDMNTPAFNVLSSHILKLINLSDISDGADSEGEG